METQEKLEIMENSEKNIQLLISSGNKLKWIGYLIFINILISFLFWILIENESSKISWKSVSQIRFLYRTWGILSLILIILKGILFIQSGRKLKKSVQSTLQKIPENKINNNLEDFVLPSHGVYFTTEYFRNGKVKVKRSYTNEGIKQGVWEYYKEDGSLDFKEVFENGEFIRNIY